MDRIVDRTGTPYAVEPSFGTLEIIGALDQQGMQRVCDRWNWGRTAGPMHPVAAAS
jgi:hypothetical protein